VKIILIGYRCTGKSQVGRRLAERRSVPFVDTDERVEAEAGKIVAEIVCAEGWEGFRLREGAAVRDLADGAEGVVATGGGAVLDRRNREALKKLGCVVWLDASPAAVIRRMAADAGNAARRPGLTGLGRVEEVERLLGERAPLYRETADIRIDTTDLGVEEVVEAIVRQLDSAKSAVPAGVEIRCVRSRKKKRGT